MTDLHRSRVRQAVRPVAFDRPSSERAGAMLDVLHQRTLTDPRSRASKDGRMWLEGPTGSDGSPFELATIDLAEGAWTTRGVVSLAKFGEMRPQSVAVLHAPSPLRPST